MGKLLYGFLKALGQGKLKDSLEPPVEFSVFGPIRLKTPHFPERGLDRGKTIVPGPGDFVRGKPARPLSELFKRLPVKPRFASGRGQSRSVRRFVYPGADHVVGRSESHVSGVGMRVERAEIFEVGVSVLEEEIHEKELVELKEIPMRVCGDLAKSPRYGLIGAEPFLPRGQTARPRRVFRFSTPRTGAF